MTAYYFAGRYSRHAELARYRDQLILALPGAEVTSRWIDCHDGELETSYTSEALAADPAGCWRHGEHDIEDLAGAEAIVSFTGDGRGGKGGRHIEHGFALGISSLANAFDNHAAAMRLIVIGPRENIFHCHPATEVYPTWEDFLRHEVAVQGFAMTRRYHPSLPAGTEN